jgi:Bacterial Ig domain/Matrixin
MRPTILLILFGLLTILPVASLAQGNLENDFIVEDNSHLMGKMTTIGDAPWQVVYLNFDGAQLKPGPSDSQQNTSILVSGSLDYPAMQSLDKFGGKDVAIKAVMDKLKIIFATVAVKFVTTRPTSGDYTMAMIGGNGQGISSSSGGAIGVSPLDCGNKNKNDICVIFGDKIASGGSPSVTMLATVVAHELGHSFGLDHITDIGGIMYPQAAGATQWAKSKSGTDAKCNKPDQDAVKVLQNNLGVGKQDKVPPKLWFKRPGNNAVLPPDFSFEVTAGDDLGVHHVTIYVDGTKKTEGSDPPFTGILRGVAEGEHTLKAEAFDWLGNKAVTAITVSVKKACVGEGTCHGGTGGIDAPCTAGGECISGVCAVKDGAGVCVDTCDASAETPVCPAGLTCKKAGEQDACLPGDGYVLSMGGGDEGGCRVGPDSGSDALPWLPLLGILALLGLAWRRR